MGIINSAKKYKTSGCLNCIVKLNNWLKIEKLNLVFLNFDKRFINLSNLDFYRKCFCKKKKVNNKMFVN